MELIERVAPRYEVTLVEMGRVYRWRPELVVTECGCGRRLTIRCSDITDGVVCVCECGEDEMVGIREELVTPLLDEDHEAHRHPWRYWHTSAETDIPY